MGSVTVRVVPRAGRASVEVQEGQVVLRVKSAPEDGGATEEARRALAAALGLPASSVRLRVGARSRTKVFEVQGMDQRRAEMRLSAT